MTRACYQLRRLPRPVRGSSGPIASTLSPASHSDAREKTMSTTHFDNPVSTPISAIPAAELTQEGSASCLAALHLKPGDAPVMLRRTDEGRALRRARYRNAASSLIPFGLHADRTSVVSGKRVSVVVAIGVGRSFRTQINNKK